MTNEEIFARIGQDVTDIYGDMFSKRDITIWMTNDLFKQLCPEQFLIHNDYAMITLFGCKVKVVLFPCDSMQWIVGYEGIADEIS